MTSPPLVPSWLNKGQPKANWPEWLTTHVIGRQEPNGSFMIKTKAGRESVQARVLSGYIVFEWRGVAYTRPAAEAPAALVEIQDGEEVFAPGGMMQKVGATPVAQAVRPARTLPTPIVRSPSRPVVAPLSKALPAKGSMPSIEWIQLDRLNVDDAYQRSVDTGPSRSLIARIGREWDWRLCVPLMVSRREAGLFVIDGQHRLSGARLRNDVPQLPCCISVYDGPADEAAMFVAANRERRTMNRLDDFHAARAGANPDAVAIAALITDAGFSVSRKTGAAAWAPGEVAFTAAIGKVRSRHGDDVVARALGMMARAFPGQRLVAGSPVFTAICAVLVTPPPNFAAGRLEDALRTFHMTGWASFLSESKGSTDRNKHLREMLLAAYDDLSAEKPT